MVRKLQDSPKDTPPDTPLEKDTPFTQSKYRKG